MNFNRIAVKTALISFGIYILITCAAFLIYTLFFDGKNDTVSVISTSVDINKGDIIESFMLVFTDIPKTAQNQYCVTDPNELIGKKAVSGIMKDDILKNYFFAKNENFYLDDERIITISLDINDRHANTIKKGSLIDIRGLKKDETATYLILEKVTVFDILDENGQSAQYIAGSKLAYVKLVLARKQLDSLYNAKRDGEILVELYPEGESG